jgi:hypothetical protein
VPIDVREIQTLGTPLSAVYVSAQTLRSSVRSHKRTVGRPGANPGERPGDRAWRASRTASGQVVDEETAPTTIELIA